MAQEVVTKRTRTLFSEGTRIAAEVCVPNLTPSPGGYPAILLCHCWGGLKIHLVPYAEAFARAGFAAMIFDYRGWGESDGRLIAPMNAPALLTAGERTLQVRVLREIVDPVDQIADANNCLTALAAEPGVDASRIGIWGSSFGGGHAVFLAGNNPLIKAVVAQVGGFGLPPEYREHAQARAVEKVQGRTDPTVPQGGVDAPPGLAGTPDLARMLLHSPLAAAANVRVPSLILDAEREELMNRLDHGFAAYEIIRQNAVCTYQTLPCTHYEVYDRYYEVALSLALNWFRTHLQLPAERISTQEAGLRERLKCGTSATTATIPGLREAGGRDPMC